MKMVIFGRGQFPISSAALRMRMWAKGLTENGIKTDIIISYPPPGKNDISEKLENEHFALPYQEKVNSSIKNLFIKIKGTYRAYKLLNKQFSDIDGVLLYGLGFLEGYFVNRFCKKKKIKFFAERCDENRQLYANRKISISEKFAMYNDLLFDKYIIKKLDAFFVVSSYLENKYKTSRQKYLNIKRSVPVFIDLEGYNKLASGNLEDIKDINTSVFKNDDLKIFFAGSCNHTNGLFFFLKCISEILKKENIIIKIILIFHSGNVNIIKEYCKELDILKYVTILPKLPFRYLPILYNKVDILILPEMGDVVANAGFPGKTGEYLASGKAIIATDFSDLSFYLKNKENAMISQLGDERKYIENLKLLIINKDLRAKVGINAKETAIKYFYYKTGVNPLIIELNK